MNPKLTVRQFRGQKGFAEICESWHGLMKSVSLQGFYHHPAWFQAYFDRPGVRDDMHFRCAYDEDRLVAVLPLNFRTRLGGIIREARFPVYDGLYMPDMALSDNVSPSVAWQQLSRPRGFESTGVWDFFSADEVLEDSAIAKSIFCTKNAIVGSSLAGRCAVLDVIDYDEVLRRLKKKFRGNLNNAKHRLSAESDVEFLTVTDKRLLSSAFEEYVDLEKAGWKGKPDKVRENYPPPAAIGLKKSKYLFYRNVVREFGELGALQIVLMRVGGKTIGAQIHILLKHICYVVKTAFDERFKRYSPGHLVLDYALKRFSDAGKIEHINLITDYEWFKYWNPRYINYLRIKAFQKSPKGRAVSVSYFFSRR